MRRIGFSSGAIAFEDFHCALRILRESSIQCVELSALRLPELAPLLESLPMLDLSDFEYVSLHAPSAFSAQEEPEVARSLYDAVPIEWPIVLHPDAIHDSAHWRRFGERLAIENMDRRKPVGRTALELQKIFERLPGARLCFDIGHARQCDPSMTESFLILSRLSQRLVEVHISEVNSASQHDPISYGAGLAFRQIGRFIPDSVPVIIESRVSLSEIRSEVLRAAEALQSRLVA